MTGPSTIDHYLSDLPEACGRARATPPDDQGRRRSTTETISYQMPTFRYRGRALLGFAAFKNQCSLFPDSRQVMVVLEQELQSYDTFGKGATIRFTTDKPLPAALVRKLVQTRIDEIEAH